MGNESMDNEVVGHHYVRINQEVVDDGSNEVVESEEEPSVISTSSNSDEPSLFDTDVKPIEVSGIVITPSLSYNVQIVASSMLMIVSLIKYSFVFCSVASASICLLSSVGAILVRYPIIYHRRTKICCWKGSIGEALSTILFLCWTFCVLMLSTYVNWSMPVNVFILAWGGFFVSFSNSGIGRKHSKTSKYQMALTATSLLLLWDVVVFATVYRPSCFRNRDITQDFFDWEIIFTLILSICTVVHSLLIWMCRCVSKKSFCCSFLRKVLAFFWIIELFANTFGGPYKTFGNGFFASWVAALLSVALAFQHATTDDDEEEEDEQQPNALLESANASFESNV